MEKEVSYEDVLQLKDDKSVYFIDVREPEEIKNTGLIPGSKNIPKGDVKAALVDYDDDKLMKTYGYGKPKLDSPIVFTCRSGKRAKDIMEVMQLSGFTNVKFYRGSWLEWEARNPNGKQ